MTLLLRLWWPQTRNSLTAAATSGVRLRPAHRRWSEATTTGALASYSLGERGGPREPLGGLCGCSPRRPPFCRRSRSARGQGRLRWRFYLCARCICGASPHLSVPRLLPKNAHAHLLRVAWQVAGASKRLLRPTTTSISSPWRPRRGPWDCISKIRPSTLQTP